MAKHERIETDGVTQTTHVSFRVDQPMSREEQEQLAAALTQASHAFSWEHKIRELEPDLQREAASTATPRYGSRAYYAREMLRQIALVRDLRDRANLRDRGPRMLVNAALAAASSLGFLAAEAWAKHDWPALRTGMAAERHQRERSAKGVQAREKKREPFILAVREYFKRHPRHSCRTAAKNLPAFRRGNGEQAIDALAKRIERSRKSDSTGGHVA